MAATGGVDDAAVFAKLESIGVRDAAAPLTVDEAGAIFDAIGDALPPTQFRHLLRALLPRTSSTAAPASTTSAEGGRAAGV